MHLARENHKILDLIWKQKLKINSINNRCTNNRAAIFLATSAILLFLGLEASRQLGLAVSLETAQLIVLPLLIAAVCSIRIYDQRVPRIAIILTVLFGVSALLINNFSHLLPRLFSRNSSELLVANLVGDELEGASRTLRKMIRQSAETDQLSVTRYPRPLSSQSEAKGLLVERSNATAVVWGDLRWLNVSFPAREPLLLSDLWTMGDGFILPELLVVDSVPMIGVSREPVIATATFLAELTLASDSMLAIFDNPGLLEQARTVGFLQAGWSANAHLAYAWWLVGNYQLVQAANEQSFQPAEYRCAQQAYLLALRYLQINSNPELKAAILNNLAVSQVAQGILEGKHKRAYRKALVFFKAASRTRKEKNLFPAILIAPYIARQNSQILLNFSGLGGKNQVRKGGGKSPKEKRRHTKKNKKRHIS
jgi:hypothetical protein